MPELVYELNFEGAKIARAAADEFTKLDPSKPRFVAGAIGPTTRTLSLSPDVNDPGFRAMHFDELAATYAEQIKGLMDGGSDVILIETLGGSQIEKEKMCRDILIKNGYIFDTKYKHNEVFILKKE